MNDPAEIESRIQKAAKNLKSMLKKHDIEADKLRAADGVIQRVAFMQVELEDLETDIKQNGTTEMFSQTEGIEYPRERPASAIYAKQIKNYMSACKQLFDLLPQEKKNDIPAAGQKLLDFLKDGGK